MSNPSQSQITKQSINVKFPFKIFFFLDIILLVLIPVLIFLSVHFGQTIFDAAEPKSLQLQYLYSYVILVILSILTASLLYIRKRTIYIAKLHSKRKIMIKLFDEINMVDFPKGDLQLRAGKYAAWFGVNVYDNQCKFEIWNIREF